MTYAELGYLRMLYEAKEHVCASKDDRECLQSLFGELCQRLNLAADTAEVFCEALEE